jgi:signal transduction histidine kinase
VGGAYNLAMTLPRPATLFRIGVVIGCGIIALPYVTRTLAGDASDVLRQAGIDDLSRIGVTGARILLAVVPAVLAALFGWAFWLNTQPEVASRARTGTSGLLALQVVIALNVSDYFFLVAAQAPFLFAPRGALLWLGGQLAVFAALVVVIALSGEQVAIPEMAGTPPSLAIPVTIVYLAGWQVFAFSVGYLAASEQRLRRGLEQRARELLATQQMLADSSRIAERAQISRELHDTIGHSLTVLNVNLELASHLTDGRAAEAVSKAQMVARMLLADVREVVHSVADERMIDLRGALITLVDGAHSPDIHLSLPERLHVDDPAKAHAVFRCVQEATTNAMRHARARNLWIDMTQTLDGLSVRVSDDGQGGSAVTPGHGLKGLHERLAEVGGWLKVHATPGRGFTLDAWVPLPKEPS